MATRVPSELFRRLTELEVHKAFRLQYPISVVCLTPDLGDEADPRLITRLADVAARHVRATDVVGMLQASCLAILFVDALSADLPGILHRVQESLTFTILAVGGTDRDVTWSVGASAYPAHTTDAAHLLELATTLMTRAQKGGGNQFLLPA